MRTRSSRHLAMKAQRGVTLIELITVMVIVGILTAIAVPSYRSYMVRANRTDAKTALLSAASGLERCFTRSNTYVGCANVALPVNEPGGHYRIEADAGNGGVAATRFAIQAVPLGSQASDSACDTFRLTNANVRSVTGTHTANDCWGK